MAMHRLTSPSAMTLRDSVGRMSGLPALKSTESKTGISLAIPSPLMILGPLPCLDYGGRECQREIRPNIRQGIVEPCLFCASRCDSSSRPRMLQNVILAVDADQGSKVRFPVLF